MLSRAFIQALLLKSIFELKIEVMLPKAAVCWDIESLSCASEDASRVPRLGFSN